MSDSKKNYTLGFVQNFIKTPIFFSFGNFIFVKYGLIFSLMGFINSLIFLFYIIIFRNSIYKIFRDFFIIVPYVTVLGSYALSYLIRIKEIFKDFNKIKEIHFFFFGGFIPTVFILYIFSLKYNINFFILTDSLAPFLLFLHGLNKSACLSYGCCAGKPKTNKGFVIIYDSPLAKINRFYNYKSIPLYPVQIYEGIGCLVLGIIIITLQNFNLSNIGLSTSIYFIGYGFLRFITEKYRLNRNNSYFKIWQYSVWQYFSILFIIVGLIIFFNIRKEQYFLNYRVIPAEFVKGDIINILFISINILFVYFISYGIHFKKLGRWGN